MRILTEMELEPRVGQTVPDELDQSLHWRKISKFYDTHTHTHTLSLSLTHALTALLWSEHALEHPSVREVHSDHCV